MSSSVHTTTKIILMYYPVQILANIQFPFTHFLHPPVNTSMTYLLLLLLLYLLLLLLFYYYCY